MHDIWIQALAWVSSIVLSIGVVWKFVEAQSPKIKKALRITEDVTALLNDFLLMTEDKKVTKEEVEKLLMDINHLQEELSKS